MLGNDEPRASVPGEVVPANEFYDYESKYTDGMMSFTIPAPLDEATTREVRELAVKAFSGDRLRRLRTLRLLHRGRDGPRARQ